MQCNAQTLVFICIYLYVNLRVVGTDGGPVVVSDGGPVVVSDGGPVEVVSDGTGVFAQAKKQPSPPQKKKGQPSKTNLSPRRILKVPPTVPMRGYS